MWFSRMCSHATPRSVFENCKVSIKIYLTYPYWIKIKLWGVWWIQNFLGDHMVKLLQKICALHNIGLRIKSRDVLFCQLWLDDWKVLIMIDELENSIHVLIGAGAAWIAVSGYRQWTFNTRENFIIGRSKDLQEVLGSWCQNCFMNSINLWTIKSQTYLFVDFVLGFIRLMSVNTSLLKRSESCFSVSRGLSSYLTDSTLASSVAMIFWIEF